MIHVEEWNTSVPRVSGYFYELYAFQAFDCRRFYLLPVKCFKVIQIAQLTRLRDTFATSKSLMTIEAQAIVYIVEKAHVEEYRTYRCTSSSLARITVNGNNVCSISYNKTSTMSQIFYRIMKLTNNPLVGFFCYCE